VPAPHLLPTFRVLSATAVGSAPARYVLLLLARALPPPSSSTPVGLEEMGLGEEDRPDGGDGWRAVKAPHGGGGVWTRSG